MIPGTPLNTGPVPKPKSNIPSADFLLLLIFKARLETCSIVPTAWRNIKSQEKGSPMWSSFTNGKDCNWVTRHQNLNTFAQIPKFGFIYSVGVVSTVKKNTPGSSVSQCVKLFSSKSSCICIVTLYFKAYPVWKPTCIWKVAWQTGNQKK